MDAGRNTSTSPEKVAAAGGGGGGGTGIISLATPLTMGHWFKQTPSLCFLASCACYSAGGRCGVSITHSHSAALLKPLGYGVLKIAIAMEPACTGSQCMVLIPCLDFQLICAPFHKGLRLIASFLNIPLATELRLISIVRLFVTLCKNRALASP